MKTTLLAALVVANALLLLSLIGRHSFDNAAIAQPARGPARPGDYLMIPGDVSGVSSGLVFIVDTTNGRLSAMTYNESARRMDTMQSIDLQGVFQRAAPGNKALHRLGNDVFQEYITQHPLLESFHPSSVVTIRMTTAIDKTGAVSLRACYLRFGSGNGTHVASTTHIRVPANVANGELDADGFAIDWTRIPAHPNTGKPFAGVRIPSFDECVSTALALHSMMPAVPAVNCIGWDMAVDKNNKVKVMEWNGDHNGIKFSEATQGPCFRDLKWHTLNQG
jgi:hypothetical protein